MVLSACQAGFCLFLGKIVFLPLLPQKRDGTQSCVPSLSLCDTYRSGTMQLTHRALNGITNIMAGIMSATGKL